MTKINVGVSFGHAPKKEFLKEFNVAFATGNSDFILAHVSEDILWNMHGDQQIKGYDAFKQSIESMKSHTADELSIHSIITHGKEAALSGEIKMGGKTYNFCDIYRFKSAGSTIIEQLDSYVVEDKIKS